MRNACQDLWAQSSARVAQPSAKIQAGEWASYHRRISDDNGWWDRRGRRVYLFADGYVAQHAASQIALANDGLPDPNLTIGGTSGFDVR